MINKDPLLFIPADKSSNLKTLTVNYCKTTSQNRTKNLTSL